MLVAGIKPKVWELVFAFFYWTFFAKPHFPARRLQFAAVTLEWRIPSSRRCPKLWFKARNHWKKELG